MSITVLNTDAGLSAKTIVNAEDGQTVTGLKTFDRDPSAPFAVSANSAVVTNLNADMVDGAHYAEGTWTPTDASGAGLTFSTAIGYYIKIGRLVMVQGQVVYPATADGSDSLIGGLPFTNSGGHGALATGFGAVNLMFWVHNGFNYFQPLNSTTGAAMTNATLSTANFSFAGCYVAPS